MTAEAQPGADDSVDLYESEVERASFVVGMLGHETDPLQFLRELTVNAIQAHRGRPGRVIWDLDWRRIHDSNGAERKLALVDTGVGMTHEELYRFVRNLAASGQTQGRHANFGMGAKLAAAATSPDGVEYSSWHAGQGARVVFCRTPDGRFGLKPLRWPDGTTSYYLPLGEDDKPWPLRGLDHGTQVVLIGSDRQRDTTAAPPVVSEGRARWIARALNGRFFDLPDSIELLVREGHKVKRGKWHDGTLTRVLGQRQHLGQAAAEAGVLELDDVALHWWILEEERRQRTLPPFPATGHVAALCDGELYELQASTSGGYARLQNTFGVRFGYQRVVIYAEPKAAADGDRPSANLTRSNLVLAGRGLDWDRWGKQFRDAMPDAIRALQQRAAAETTSTEAVATVVREKLSGAQRLYRLSRYRVRRQPAAPRALSVEPTLDGEPTDRRLKKRAANSARQARGGKAAIPRDVVAAPAADTVDEPPTEDLEPVAELSIPEIVWVGVADGTRAEDDLEDVAARWNPEERLLICNADHVFVTDLVSHYCSEYDSVAGARETIEAAVRELFSLSLIETIVTAEELSRRPRWAGSLGRMLSEEALTQALCSRWLIDQALKKRLAQRLGPARPGAS